MHRHKFLLKNSFKIVLEHVKDIWIIVFCRYFYNFGKQFNRNQLFYCNLFLGFHLHHLGCYRNRLLFNRLFPCNIRLQQKFQKSEEAIHIFSHRIGSLNKLTSYRSVLEHIIFLDALQCLSRFPLLEQTHNILKARFFIIGTRMNRSFRE